MGHWNGALCPDLYVHMFIYPLSSAGTCSCAFVFPETSHKLETLWWMSSKVTQVLIWKISSSSGLGACRMQNVWHLSPLHQLCMSVRGGGKVQRSWFRVFVHVSHRETDTWCKLEKKSPPPPPSLTRAVLSYSLSATAYVSDVHLPEALHLELRGAGHGSSTWNFGSLYWTHTDKTCVFSCSNTASGGGGAGQVFRADP